MRSELVYRANDKVQNRFQLCRLTSTSARTMSRSSVGMHLTINQALEAIGAQSIVLPLPSAVALTDVPQTEAPVPMGFFDPAV